ncbi:MAG TPA: hypothetical protein VGI21_02915 [Streptosporangiaceae bacterium]|jgi:hypothetical protein
MVSTLASEPGPGEADGMRAVLRVAELGLRARWRDWLVLTLLIGLAGGTVLAAAAGARRTASAYPRFLAWSHASDLLVAASGGLGGYDQALGHLPGVAASAPLVVLNAEPVSKTGQLDQDQVVAPLDGRFGTTLDRPKLLAGRAPGPAGRARSWSTSWPRPAWACTWAAHWCWPRSPASRAVRPGG